MKKMYFQFYILSFPLCIVCFVFFIFDDLAPIPDAKEKSKNVTTVVCNIVVHLFDPQRMGIRISHITLTVEIF